MKEEGQVDQDRLEVITMIRDSVAAVVSRGGDLKRIRALRFTTPGFDHSIWRDMCGMGKRMIADRCRESDATKSPVLRLKTRANFCPSTTARSSSVRSNGAPAPGWGNGGRLA